MTVFQWIFETYPNNPKYEQTEYTDTALTPQNVDSNQNLHCLPLIQQFLDTSTGSKMHLFKF